MHLNRAVAIALFGTVGAAGLSSLQYGDNRDLNGMPFEKVEQLVPALPKAQEMAKKGNVDFLAEQAIAGEAVKLRGELTDANCYLAAHAHSYDHAFCAKLCVAAGSPLIFLPDERGPLYVVLSAKNGVRLSHVVLDQIGVPGLEIKAKILQGKGLKALAVQDVE